MEIWPWLLVIGMFALAGLWALWERFELPGSIMWRAQRSLRRHIERLGRLSTAELVSETRKIIGYEEWKHIGQARALLERDDWTDQSLLRALEDLCKALYEDDEAHDRRGGPGTYYFELQMPASHPSA